MRCVVESFIRDARGPRGDARLSRIHAVETNPHPDLLPFTKGEGIVRWPRVRVTEQGSEKGACWISSPRSERGEDQGEYMKARLRRHWYNGGKHKQKGIAHERVYRIRQS